MTERQKQILDLAKELMSKNDEYDKNNIPVKDRDYSEIKAKMKNMGINIKDHFSNIRK